MPGPSCPLVPVVPVVPVVPDVPVVPGPVLTPPGVTVVPVAVVPVPVDDPDAGPAAPDPLGPLRPWSPEVDVVPVVPGTSCEEAVPVDWTVEPQAAATMAMVARPTAYGERMGSLRVCGCCPIRRPLPADLHSPVTWPVRAGRVTGMSML